MTWEQIGRLNAMGFEIGNHTRRHTHVNNMSRAQFVEELTYIERKGAEYGIPKPESFAYPAYDTDPMAIPVLKEKGYRFARIGEDRAYDPEQDHPFLIPSFSTMGDDKERVLDAIRQARDGRIVVLTVHGVPDDAHPWVNKIHARALVWLFGCRTHDPNRRALIAPPDEPQLQAFLTVKPVDTLVVYRRTFSP